jgi:hypothetical protein
MTVITFNGKCPPIHGNPLAYEDARFINTLYQMPVGALLEMDKERLRDTLAKTNLVCDWLEGILALRIELELEQKGN